MYPVLPRHRYLELLRAALAVQRTSFARQAAINWLAVYPGDLQVGLLYAQALAADNRRQAAISVLQGLLRADPEYLETLEVLLSLEPGAATKPASLATPGPGIDLRSAYFALAGHNQDLRTLASWGGTLWLARQRLAQGDLALAGSLLEEILRDAPGQALVHVTHLAYLAANPGIDLVERLEIAQDYARRWPDCLACSLHLADWMVQRGDSGQAVALLHQAAARDVSGQVASRLWGEKHAYRGLWPERLELPLEVQLPLEVAAALGWNLLPTSSASVYSPPLAGLSDLSPLAPALNVTPGAGRPDAGSRVMQGASPFSPVTVAPGANSASAGRKPASINSSVGGEAPAAQSHSAAKRDTERTNGSGRPDQNSPGRRHDQRGAAAKAAARAEMHTVALELDRLARSWKLPEITLRDGRYPVYVLFSLKGGLQAVYGPQVAAVEQEMNELASTVRQRRGWGACVFFADQLSSVGPFDLRPVRSADPWELKLALADLDAALARQGARIGAVLIVGGPEIVPFHHLPNPVDDPDVDVASDNPYASRDENYFTPDWPVGRLPGGAANDATLLCGSLRSIRCSHQAKDGPAPKNPGNLWGLRDWLRQQIAHYRKVPGNFGYTAAIWQQAAALVYHPIGRPAALKVSPPLGIYSYDPAVYAANVIPALVGRLGYFNLHGLVDAPEWFGQRDPLAPAEGPDYPVALRPRDIGPGNGTPTNPSEPPRIVFSEACYGLHIQGRTPEDAIALKFLQAGSLAVAGSTCMAYGSVDAPLVAADLLGHTFWSLLQEGLPAGEALRQAKLHLAATMHRRQGHLDGEDQKTLISFTLLGDPLAQAVPAGRLPKSLRLSASSVRTVCTVCDRAEPGAPAVPLSPAMAASVRRVVARYLPGMSDARLVAVRPRPDCTGEGHSCPTSQLERGLQSASDGSGRPARRGGKSRGNPPRKGELAGAQRLITLSKQIAVAGGVHPRLARLTLGEHGELIKLVVSR